MDRLEPVDSYLYEVGRIGAEQVICDGCLSGRVPEAVAGCCTIEPELIHRTVEDDGGTAEGYQGALVVAGGTLRVRVPVIRGPRRQLLCSQHRSVRAGGVASRGTHRINGCGTIG
jgi:hypothetical protein